jgi:hypothetical protein
LEKKGIPTAIICSDAFLALAKSISTALGISSPRLVVIPHPLAGIPADEVRIKADNVVITVVEKLTGR